jgi:hypothetical protein
MIVYNRTTKKFDVFDAGDYVGTVETYLDGARLLPHYQRILPISSGHVAE